MNSNRVKFVNTCRRRVCSQNYVLRSYQATGCTVSRGCTAAVKEHRSPRLIVAQTEEESLTVPYTWPSLREVAGTTSKGSCPPCLVSTATTASDRSAPTVTLEQAPGTEVPSDVLVWGRPPSSRKRYRRQGNPCRSTM